MKYYAVAEGRQTGIFATWAECQEQTKGYRGAKFKSFTNLKDAEKFVNNADAILDADAELKRVYTVAEAPKVFKSTASGVGFVGSNFDSESGFYGYSYVLATGGELHTFSLGDDLMSVQQLGAIGVEMLAISRLAVKARDLGVGELTLYYKNDWAGKWYTEGCNSKNEDVIKYIALLDKIHAKTTLRLHKLPKKCSYGLYIKAKDMANDALNKYKGEL